VSEDREARVHQFVQRLIKGTAAGRVEWRQENDRQFFAAAEGGTVTVGSRTARGEHPYSLTVENANGVVVDETSTILGDYYTTEEAAIAQLYEAAREAALDLDGVLTDLSKEWGL